MADNRNAKRNSKGDKNFRRPRKKVCNFCVDRVEEIDYKDVEKLKDIDFIEYVKEKEILFIKEDIQKVKGEKTDYTRLIKYYKRKLVDFGVMKEIRDYKTKDGKFIKSKVSTIMNEYVSA